MQNFRNNIAKTLAGLSEADIVVEFVKKSGDHRYGFFFVLRAWLCFLRSTGIEAFRGRETTYLFGERNVGISFS